MFNSIFNIHSYNTNQFKLNEIITKIVNKTNRKLDPPEKEERLSCFLCHDVSMVNPLTFTVGIYAKVCGSYDGFWGHAVELVFCLSWCFPGKSNGITLK